MNKPHDTKWRATLLTGALVCLIAPYAPAQQNPFQSLKDALDKAKQQVQQKTSSTSAAGTPAQPTSAAPAAPAAAPTVPASSASAPASTSANVFVPPTERPSKPAGPLDPAKLMDIAGVHIGMPMAETVPILKKIHPEAALHPDTLVRGEPMAAYWIGVSTPIPPKADDVWVNYTFDTLQVYAVSRGVRYQPQIDKSTLIAALRKKYGPETAALSFSSSPKTDNDITKMWWLSDEEGQIVHAANLSTLTSTPYGCASRGAGGSDMTSNYRSAFRDLQNGKPPAATFCDSIVTLYIEFDNGSNAGHNDPTLVMNSRSMLFDSALFRRSTIAWAQHLDTQAQQQQQQSLQKANQAKPNL